MEIYVFVVFHVQRDFHGQGKIPEEDSWLVNIKTQTLNQRRCNKLKWIDENVVDWQREVELKLIDEKDKLSMEANIMHSKVFILENEIKRVNEELEKKKKKLKMERKSGMGIGRLVRRLKHLDYWNFNWFFC